jgi:hypothetical protein
MNFQKYNIRRLATKAQTKAEIYSILVVEGHFYLPPQKETTMKFVREIAKGTKKVFDVS